MYDVFKLTWVWVYTLISVARDESFNPLYAGDSYMSTLAKSVDPDEMPRCVAFHQGLHCLLRQKKSSEK